MKVFKFYYLNAKHICTISNPYTGLPCQSSRAEFEWTSYLDFKYPHLKLQTAFNHKDGQKRFGKYTCDAYSAINKTVYTFKGCYYHAHSSEDCKMKTKIKRTNAEEIRNLDNEKEANLKLNFSSEVQNIHCMYECEWKKFKFDNPLEMPYIWSTTEIDPLRPLSLLVPRVSLRGGFLETYKLKALATPSQEISFVDCNSLYSHIAMQSPLPLGTYETLTHSDLVGNIEFRSEQFFYKGESMNCDIAHVKIVAPSNLKYPFLMYRVNNEHNFISNCFTCASKKLTRPCHHSDEKKAFVSTWTVRELAYACKLNYKILYWYEVHHFADQEVLLKDFVKVLASEKLKNSNLFDYKDDKLKREIYCNYLNETMEFDNNLSLSRTNTQDNVMLKQFYKNCLNSLYGRFALHTNHSEHIFCKTLRDVQLLVNDKCKTILEYFTINDSTLQIEVIDILKQQLPNHEGNLYFTSLINSSARIFMYNIITQLLLDGCDLLSVDTDALCFAHVPNYKYPFTISDAFGHFKHVCGMNAKIKAFYSLGVRNYIVIYEDLNGMENYVCKMKGLSLQSVNCAPLLKPSSFIDFVEKHFTKEIDHLFIPQMRCKIDKQTKSYKQMLLKYDFTNEIHIKRFLRKNSFETLPYGFSE